MWQLSAQVQSWLEFQLLSFASNMCYINKIVRLFANFFVRLPVNLFVKLQFDILIKGQLISKQNCRAVTSPKKRKKHTQVRFIHFLGEVGQFCLLTFSALCSWLRFCFRILLYKFMPFYLIALVDLRVEQNDMFIFQHAKQDHKDPDHFRSFKHLT